LAYLSEFSDCIFNNYIIGGCPSIWAKSSTDALRNTNESFHKHFNSQFYSLHLSLTSVIGNLKLIHTESYLKINELKKGKIKPIDVKMKNNEYIFLMMNRGMSTKKNI